MPIPEMLQQAIKSFIQGDEKREFFVTHILKSQLNVNMYEDSKLREFSQNDKRKITLDHGVRNWENIRPGQHFNPLLKTDEFERVLSEYENSELSLKFQEFIELSIGDKNGQHIMKIGELDFALDEMLASLNNNKQASSATTNESSSKPAVASSNSSTSSNPSSSSSSSTSTATSERKISSTELIKKLLNSAPFIFASFDMHSRQQDLELQARSIKHTMTRPNKDQESLAKALESVEQQLQMYNQSRFMRFLNQHNNFTLVFIKFYKEFEKVFNKNEQLKSQFLDAILGERKENHAEHGLMQGEPKALQNFLAHNPEIAAFLQDHVDDLKNASKKLVEFSPDSYNRLHIDQLISADAHQLVADIRNTINNLCEEAANTLNAAPKKKGFFSKSEIAKSPIFTAINNGNVSLRNTLNDITNAFTPENQSESSISQKALSNLRKTLRGVSADVSDAFNGKAKDTRSDTEKDLSHKIEKAIQGFYQRAEDIGDRAAVFERVYTTTSQRNESASKQSK